MQACHRPAGRRNLRLRNQTRLRTTNCKRPEGRQKSKPLTIGRVGLAVSGHACLFLKNTRGGLRSWQQLLQPSGWPGNSTGRPSKGLAAATTQMVIISQQVKLWKVPSIQESLTLNNEHTSLPRLPWDILFCFVSAFSTTVCFSLFNPPCFENRG